VSASNIAVCPRCLLRAQDAHQAEVKVLVTAYGTIPAEEWAARVHANRPPEPRQFRMFAEYYEISGAETGTVTVDYGAKCETCGLELSFRNKYRIPGIDTPVRRGDPS